MGKTVFCAAALLVCFCFSSTAQGKISADPNAVGSEPAAAKEVDQRLARKITYNSGSKRLHAVVDDLRKLSGVSISCGQNKSDWRVRDIPIVVCVKEMPLGELLRAIADATHTWFASEKIGSEPLKSYRIYRRYIEEQRIDEFFRSRHEARLEAAKWQWNALSAYGKSTENIDLPDWVSAARASTLRQTARLIASLDPDAEDRMLAGETLRFSGSNAAFRDTLAKMYEDVRKTRISPPLPQPSPELLDALSLQVKLTDTGDEGDTRLDTLLSPIMESPSGWSGFASACDANLLCGKLPDLPPCPTEVEPPSYTKDMGNPALIPLSRYADETWDHPKLKAKVDLLKPNTIENPTFADLMTAVAEEGGLNIVTEDFTSHQAFVQNQGWDYQSFDRLFAKGVDVASTLTNISWNSHMAKCTDYVWFFDEKHGLLIGWADNGTLLRWRDHHRNLVPEDFLSRLKARLDGPGLELDDVLPLVDLREDSINEWIRSSKDFAFLETSGASAWRLYYRLDAEDKERARSVEGLPLAKFDPQWISGFFQIGKLAAGLSMEDPAPPLVDRKWYDANQKAVKRHRDFARAIIDPRIVPTAVLRVVKSPAKYRWTLHRGMISVPAELKLSSYEIWIDYTVDNEKHSYNAGGQPLAFPVWSPEREAALIKAAAEEEKNREGGR